MMMGVSSTILFLLATLLPAAFTALVAGFVMRRLAPRWGLIDKPNARKVHVTPTPLGGGIAIWLGTLLPFAGGTLVLVLVHYGMVSQEIIPSFASEHLAGLWQQLPRLWILLGAATVLMLLGLADDKLALDWKIRLAVQLGVALLCVVTQGWQLTAFIAVPAITMGLSVLWITALVNSFNMLDNMDGLSGGVAAIAAGMLAAVLLLNPDPQTQRPQLFVAGLLLVLAGAILGFLFHNRPPARIFMGDAGSYFIGFTIAVATLLATYAGYHGVHRHAVLAPLCVMAVPLYDMITVLYIRIREGRSPFVADKCHFSHRLVDLGFTKVQAVLTIYLTTATCGLGALLLQRVDLVGAVIIILLIGCVLSIIALIESTARRRMKA